MRDQPKEVRTGLFEAIARVGEAWATATIAVGQAFAEAVAERKTK